jgi:hypothetical protein
MAYIRGEGRGQGTLLPVMLDDFVSIDHVCRVIDAFVVRLNIGELGFDWRLRILVGPATIRAICLSFIYMAI